MLLNGWEEFDEPVDRIVSIGAFEHFGHDRYDDFFTMAYGVLPDDGLMLLPHDHRIDGAAMYRTRHTADVRNSPLHQVHGHRDLPGGRLPSIEKVEDHSASAGFTLSRRQSLQLHYARTLDLWAAGLQARKDEAIGIQSEEVYQRFIKYLTGCANAFRVGYIDVNQFTLEK